MTDVAAERVTGNRNFIQVPTGVILPKILLRYSCFHETQEMNNIAADLLNLPVYYNQYYIC